MIRIFIGPYGLRAGWRFLLFLAIAAIVGSAYAALVHRVSALLSNYTGAVAALAGMLVMSRIEGKPIPTFGLSSVNRGRNLVAGAITGFAALSSLMGLLVVSHAFRPSAPELHGIDIVRWGLYWAVLFVGVSASEELVTRGYPLFSLSQGIGFWPVAVTLSLLFGAGHLGNSGEEWIGIVNAVIAGLVFAYSVKWTGSLWWAMGCHMTWDWGESFFYGVADSGSKASHRLFSGDPIGPAWLSGGSVGPEGSVLAAIVLLLLIVVVRFSTRPVDNAELHRLTRPAPVDNPQDPGGVPVA